MNVVSRHAAFVEGFVLPLLEGGVCEVGAPLPASFRSSFVAAAMPSAELDDRIAVCLERDVGALLGRALAVRHTLGEAALALAMAGYDLAAALDPMLARVFARSARPAILRFAAELAEAAGAPVTRYDALARHAVVGRLLALSRNDVVVRNWAATYRFPGRPVPWNVVALPTLRRVRTETSTRSLVSLLESEPTEVRAVASTILDASPLSALLVGPTRPTLAPPQLVVLADEALGPAVVHALARDPVRLATFAEGLATARLGATGARLALGRFTEAWVLAMLDSSDGGADEPSSLDAFVMGLGIGALEAGLVPPLEPRDRGRVVSRAAFLERRAPTEPLVRGRALVDALTSSTPSPSVPESRP